MILTNEDIHAIQRTEPAYMTASCPAFARAIEVAVLAKLAQGTPELIDAAKDEHGGCIVCGVRFASVAAYVNASNAAARVNALEEAAQCMEEQDTQAPKHNAAAIRALKGKL